MEGILLGRGLDMRAFRGVLRKVGWWIALVSHDEGLSCAWIYNYTDSLHSGHTLLNENYLHVRHSTLALKILIDGEI